MSLPVLELTGTALEQGRAHGEALRERIGHNLAVYFERFRREVGLERDELLRRAEIYCGSIRQSNPDYVEGMRGISEGSGYPFGDIAVLNVRYELIYQAWGRQLLEKTPLPPESQPTAPEQEGCTSFAVLPSHSWNGHLILGQNWDWLPAVLGAVVKTAEPDGLRTLGFTEAGIFGSKIGLNSAGIGLAINGMLSTEDDWSRLGKPFHVRCHEILRCRDFDAAVGIVTGERRSCSTNFMIAQADDRVIDIEAAPDALDFQHPENGCLSHANNFVAPERVGVREPISDRRNWSCRRRDRMAQLLHSRTPVTRELLEEYLKDHADYPNALCRHPDPSLPEEQRSVTVTGVIMDLHAGTMDLTDGQPCQSPFQPTRL